MVSLIEKPIRNLFDVSMNYLCLEEIKKRMDIKRRWASDDSRCTRDVVDRRGVEIYHAQCGSDVDRTPVTTIAAQCRAANGAGRRGSARRCNARRCG